MALVTPTKQSEPDVDVMLAMSDAWSSNPRIRPTPELARQVSGALAAEVKRLQQFVKNAERYARLQELHDGGTTGWHVRGADGQPICVGGLDKTIDETFKTSAR